MCQERSKIFYNENFTLSNVSDMPCACHSPHLKHLYELRHFKSVLLYPKQLKKCCTHKYRLSVGFDDTFDADDVDGGGGELVDCTEEDFCFDVEDA